MTVTRADADVVRLTMGGHYDVMIWAHIIAGPPTAQTTTHPPPLSDSEAPGLPLPAWLGGGRSMESNAAAAVRRCTAARFTDTRQEIQK